MSVCALGLVLVAIAMPAAHTLGAYQGRRRLFHQRRMKALVLAKAGRERQAAPQRRMEVGALAKAGVDKADEGPSVRALQMNASFSCLL